MAQITVLDQNTINKIAAGEVIERPAAVVKELVENAIDASASAITVEIKEGGISFIRITDNGTGISKDQVKVAFLRHSTSKIKSVEDLIHVSSLGFRGEALSSISAVAQVELITKTASDLTGVRYTIEGGVEKEYQEIGCPEGTTFLVRNLFYNTPARRKFLKSASTEAGYIHDLMMRMAVSHPQVSFHFINQNQTKFHTSGNGNLKDIIYHIYGREITSQIVPVTLESEHIQIEGFIGKPSLSRGNRNYENYFINGRYVKSSLISKAIEDAYRPYTMQHRYPFTALHYTIQSDLLDVNVHPTKMELRFSNNDEVYKSTSDAIQNALVKKEWIASVSFDSAKEKQVEAKEKIAIPEPFERNRIESNRTYSINQEIPQNQVHPQGQVHPWNQVHPQGQVQQKTSRLAETSNYTSFRKVYPEGIPQDRKDEPILNTEVSQSNESINENEAVLTNELSSISGTTSSAENEEVIKDIHQMTFFEDKLLSKEAKKEYKLIGQLFSTYWIIEYQQKMFIIDQHAAHEKILYEKTMKNLKEKEILKQMVQPPIILTLSIREEEAVKEHMDILHSFGFEIEHFGGREYTVRAVPSNLYGVAQNDLLIEVIDALVDEDRNQTPIVLLEKIASISCKAAVKGNYTLSVTEAEALMEQLLELENPYFCPHGRPVIISMSKTEIEKKFKRIV